MISFSFTGGAGEGEGGFNDGGFTDVWFFWSRNLKLEMIFFFLVVLRSIMSLLSGIVLFSYHLLQKKKKKKREKKRWNDVWNFQKDVAFKNNLVLKKDIEEVVKCLIISMYLNTIILLQYCWCHSRCSCLNGYDIVMFLGCWVIIIIFYNYFYSIHS